MMLQEAVLEREETNSSEVAISAIVERLWQLPPEQLADVLQFVEFLAYKSCITPDDPSEDEALWQAVLAHERYKAEHPDEPIAIYKSREELLAALAEL
jgi:hypothetical protein